MNHRISALDGALRPVVIFAVSGRPWVYKSSSTIRQGVKANADAWVLKAKLAFNWTGPYKVHVVSSVPLPTPRMARHSAIASFVWISFRPTWFGCSMACGDRALQAL